MKTVVVELPDRITTEIGTLVENGWFANETEIIQTALWEFMRRNRLALAGQYLLNKARRSWLSLSKPTAFDKLRPRFPRNIEKIGGAVQTRRHCPGLAAASQSPAKPENQLQHQGQ